jgi:hypothetical protein
MKYILINSLFTQQMLSSQHELRWHLLSILQEKAKEEKAALVFVNETLNILDTANAMRLTVFASQNPFYVLNYNESTRGNLDTLSSLGLVKFADNFCWDESKSSGVCIVLPRGKKKGSILLNLDSCFDDCSVPLAFSEQGLHFSLVDTKSLTLSQEVITFEEIGLSEMPVKVIKEASITSFTPERESLFSNLLKKNQAMLSNEKKDDESEIMLAIDNINETGGCNDDTANYIKGLLLQS